MKRPSPAIRPKLTLKDANIAKGLTDLVDQAKKTRRVWKSHAAGEKGPLNKLVKIVGNFFTSADEKVGALLEKYEPVVEAYIQKVNDQKERERQEEIRRQQEKEAQARAAAEAAQRDAEEKQRAAEEHRRKEAEARAAAERAARERAESEARAEEAKAEEKLLADLKRERDRAEKERNATALREINADVENRRPSSHALRGRTRRTMTRTGALNTLIRYGGTINAIIGPVLSSPLLDDNQSDDLRAMNVQLAELRNAQNARSNKREQAKREKARLAAEAKKRKQAEARRIQRKKEQAEYVAAEKKARRKRTPRRRRRPKRSGARTPWRANPAKPRAAMNAMPARLARTRQSPATRPTGPQTAPNRLDSPRQSKVPGPRRPWCRRNLGEELETLCQ